LAEAAAPKQWDTVLLARWQAAQRAAPPPSARRSSAPGCSTPPMAASPGLLPTASPSPHHGPISLNDGGFLHASKRSPRTGQDIGFSVSNDDGRTWQWLRTLPTRPGDNPERHHELHAIEAAHGRLLAPVRNHNPANERESLQSESSDGSKSWSIPRPIGVWGPLPSAPPPRRPSAYYLTATNARPVETTPDSAPTTVAPGPIPPSCPATAPATSAPPPPSNYPADNSSTSWYDFQHTGSHPAQLPPPPFSILRLARWCLG
jgi:hypothetical protein